MFIVTEYAALINQHLKMAKLYFSKKLESSEILNSFVLTSKNTLLHTPWSELQTNSSGK